MCDQRMLLSTYNRAAKQLNRKLKQPLALWSTAVVELSPPQTQGPRFFHHFLDAAVAAVIELF
jgi:hypothetical protein